MPARRRKRYQHKEKKVGNKTKKIFLSSLILLIIAFIVLFLSLLILKSNWSAKNRFVLTIPNSETGDVVTAIFDEHSETIVAVTIPKNTEVTAARNLGKWKMGSILKLGEQEKLSGEFVAETVLKTFKLPSDAWAQEPAIGFVDGDIPEVLKAIFSPYQSNLHFKDKVKLALFRLRVKKSDILNIDLSQTSGLTSKVLADGEKGYVPKEELSPQVLSYFVDSELGNLSPHTIIIDSTDSTVAADVGAVLEILGANVLSIKETIPSDTDCVVRSKESVVASRVAKVFKCITDGEPQSNFDLEVVLGKKFAKRF